jgi:hypothetical protein
LLSVDVFFARAAYGYVCGWLINLLSSFCCEGVREVDRRSREIEVFSARSILPTPKHDVSCAVHAGRRGSRASSARCRVIGVRLPAAQRAGDHAARAQQGVEGMGARSARQRARSSKPIAFSS